MTIITEPPSETEPVASAPSTLARSLSVVAVAASIPYAALKIAWLGGSRIGLADAQFGTGAAMYVANALTLALDLSATALAVCFATRRGLRAPALLVVFPMWVGYGLLAQVMLLVPGTVLSNATASTSSTGPIRQWVYVLVYLGFAGLGLCLLPAFALYTARRWPTRLRRPVNRGVSQRPMLWTVLPAAACVVGALGGALALDGGTSLSLIADALLAGVGTVGLTGLLLARSTRPTWVPLLAAFTGTGALFAWGLFHLVLETVPNDLVVESVPTIAIVYSAARVVAGAIGGLALRRWWRAG